MDKRDVCVARMRSMEEMERFGALWELLLSDTNEAWQVLRRVKVDDRHLSALFDMGLVLSDVSSCYFWLEIATSRVGFLTTVGWVGRHLESSPLCVEKAFYSLELLAQKLHGTADAGYRRRLGLDELSDWEYERARNAVRDLVQRFNARYPKFLTTTSKGSHPDGQKRKSKGITSLWALREYV